MFGQTSTIFLTAALSIYLALTLMCIPLVISLRNKLREQIATLRETPSIYLDEAEVIANRLGINPNNNDVEKSVHQ